MSFVRKFMELEIIRLSKISKTERQILHVLSHMQNVDLRERTMSVTQQQSGVGNQSERRAKGGWEGVNMIKVLHRHAIKWNNEAH
jgi:hypothetical protein